MIKKLRVERRIINSHFDYITQKNQSVFSYDLYLGRNWLQSLQSGEPFKFVTVYDKNGILSFRKFYKRSPRAKALYCKIDPKAHKKDLAYYERILLIEIIEL